MFWLPDCIPVILLDFNAQTRVRVHFCSMRRCSLLRHWLSKIEFLNLVDEFSSCRPDRHILRWSEICILFWDEKIFYDELLKHWTINQFARTLDFWILPQLHFGFCTIRYKTISTQSPKIIVNIENFLWIVIFLPNCNIFYKSNFSINYYFFKYITLENPHTQHCKCIW